MSVVVDTQILLWYVLDSRKLSSAAADRLDEVAESGEYLLVPTISLVEIEYLRDKRVVTGSASDKLRSALEDPKFALRPVPLDLNVVRNIPQVPRNIVPDMPDRIIAATALALGLPLVSSDARIRRVAELKVIW